MPHTCCRSDDEGLVKLGRMGKRRLAAGEQHQELQPRGRTGDRKYGWRNNRERQPVGKVQLSHLIAISGLLPHTSPEMLLNLF